MYDWRSGDGVLGYSMGNAFCPGGYHSFHNKQADLTVIMLAVAGFI